MSVDFDKLLGIERHPADVANIPCMAFRGADRCARPATKMPRQKPALGWLYLCDDCERGWR